MYVQDIKGAVQKKVAGGDMTQAYLLENDNLVYQYARNILIQNIAEKFVAEGGTKARHGVVPRLQRLFTSADNIERYLQDNKLYKDFAKVIGDKKDGLDSKELEEINENVNNIIWGAIFSEFESGQSNFENEEKFTKWVSELSSRSFSAYLGLVQADTISTEYAIMETDKGYDPKKVTKEAGILLEEVIPNLPRDYFSEETGGIAGRATYEQIEDFNDLTNVLAQAMNNINGKREEITVQEFYALKGGESRLVKRKGDVISKTDTSIDSNAFYINEDHHLAVRSRDGRYEYVFRGVESGFLGTGLFKDKNTDRIDVEVYEIDSKTGERRRQMQTIQDLFAKGKRK